MRFAAAAASLTVTSFSLVDAAASTTAATAAYKGAPFLHNSKLHYSLSTAIATSTARSNTLTVLQLINMMRGGATSQKAVVKNTNNGSNQSSPTSKRQRKASTASSKRKSKKKRKRNDPKIDEYAQDAAKMDTAAAAEVNQVLKEKDSAAQALGDAIRDRADQLLQLRPRRYEDHDYDDDGGTPAAVRLPFVSDTSRNGDLETPPFSTTVHRNRRDGTMTNTMPDSMRSLGWAMGATDYYSSAAAETISRNTGSPVDLTTGMEHPVGAGGVEAAPASVLVHYFLKSHGGAHALQCTCSALAAAAGLGAILLWHPPISAGATSTTTTTALSLTLLKRSLLFAMIKHVSGLVAASYLAATAIPDTGFRQAVQWMRELVTDPVSQYVFYAATILLWLPPTGKTAAVAAGWWQSYRLAPVILVGPVVLREVISTALVLSDVLVLTACSGRSSSSTSSGILKRLLTVSQAVVNAVMSLLVTPTVWRSATAAQRQAILAKLTSKVSLAMEVAVGLLMLVDAIVRVLSLIFTSSSSNGGGGGSYGTTTLLPLVKSLVCTRLYVQFLWTRRRKIRQLAATVRGGAGAVPLYVLGVLLDPSTSMGLVPALPSSAFSAPPLTANGSKESRSDIEWTWKDYASIALGLND